MANNALVGQGSLKRAAVGFLDGSALLAVTCASGILMLLAVVCIGVMIFSFQFWGTAQIFVLLTAIPLLRIYSRPMPTDPKTRIKVVAEVAALGAALGAALCVVVACCDSMALSTVSISDYSKHLDWRVWEQIYRRMHDLEQQRSHLFILKAALENGFDYMFRGTTFAVFAYFCTQKVRERCNLIENKLPQIEQSTNGKKLLS